MNVSQDVMEILDQCRVEKNALFLPDIQLERKLYVAVNKVLAAMGGKWKRGQGAHVFASSPYDDLDLIILTGEYTDAKKEFGFFETPNYLAEKMVEIAEIKEGEKCLEPSAGHGRIASLMPGCDCVEILPGNQEILTANGHNVIWDNFLTFGGQYDVIVANPPFARQQDVDHINHMLNIASRCVISVASAGLQFRTTNKTVALRQRIKDLDGWIESLPEGTFQESGTLVNTCLVVVPDMR